MGDGAMCHECRRYECICPAEPTPITDTQRLDWLFAHPSYALSPVGKKSGECVVWDQSNGLVAIGRGPNQRAAIDAAIRAQEGQR